MEYEPPPPQRHVFLAILLTLMGGGGFLVFLIAITGGFFLYFLLAVGGIFLLATVNYVLWGRSMMRQAAGEREELEGLAEDDDWSEERT